MKTAAEVKLVALGMTSEVVVILQNENARRFSCLFAEEICGGQPADSASNDDQIICFLYPDWLAGRFPKRAIAEAVRGFKRSRMAAPQTFFYRWIISWLILRLRRISLAKHAAGYHGSPD